MKLGTLLLVLHDIIEDLVSLGVIIPDGNMNSEALDTVRENVQFAVMIENRLKQHGVVVKSEVDKVINALPLLLTLVVN